MFKKGLYILGCVSLLLGCGEEEYALPDHILDKETIIPVIVDLQVLESHFQRQFARADLYRNSLDSSSVFIFEKHGITKAQFDESINYYSEMPDTLFVIYEAALDTINYRLDSAD